MNETRKETRSSYLVCIGLVVYISLYAVQASILVNFMVEHIDKSLWWYLLLFVPSFVLLVCYLIKCSYATNNDQLSVVWLIWATYIPAFFIAVAVIFAKVEHHLDSAKKFGPNSLKGILCITPTLLILLLYLTICPTYRKSILSISVTAALDIFDGIEMLEIILLQNERDDFQLSNGLKIAIIVFACACFAISPLGLARNKMTTRKIEENGVKFSIKEIKERKDTSIWHGLIQIFCINLPFLILRLIVWFDCDYEASIFISKNIISLVISVIEIAVLSKCCTCG